MKIAMILAVIVSTSAFAQVSPEEAKAKLAEREAQRNAERSQVVQITAGELADLRAKVKQLEAEVRVLRASAGKATPKKPPETIEIGMSKDEVIAFVKAHSSLQIISITATSGTTKSREQTTVRQRESTGDGISKEGIPQNTSDVRVDRLVKSGKTERINIARFGRFTEQSGSRRNALGGQTPVYQTVDRQEGSITVTLVDDVVTAVDAH